jgi:hypothetical protein
METVLGHGGTGLGDLVSLALGHVTDLAHSDLNAIVWHLLGTLPEYCHDVEKRFSKKCLDGLLCFLVSMCFFSESRQVMLNTIRMIFHHFNVVHRLSNHQ